MYALTLLIISNAFMYMHCILLEAKNHASTLLHTVHCFTAITRRKRATFAPTAVESTTENSSTQD